MIMRVEMAVITYVRHHLLYELRRIPETMTEASAYGSRAFAENGVFI